MNVPISAIVKALSEDLLIHPKAQLIDIYKFFYQDAFGPGHLITDVKAARRLLQKEVRESEIYEEEEFQRVGYRNRFCRLNLKLVKENKISEDEVIEEIIETAYKVISPGNEAWEQEWSCILEVIRSMNLDINNYDSDLEKIKYYNSKNEYLFHHSESYINSYNPHYRLVSFDFAFKLIC